MIVDKIIIVAKYNHNIGLAIGIGQYRPFLIGYWNISKNSISVQPY